MLIDWGLLAPALSVEHPPAYHATPTVHEIIATPQTIVRYLREVRPARPDRTLFLSLNAPLRPITRDVITHVVHSRLGHLGVTGKRRGPHALRHAAAQRLLDHGLSMKQVGDYLGHRSVAATSVYAKLRLDALREVAAIDPEGLA